MVGLLCKETTRRLYNVQLESAAELIGGSIWNFAAGNSLVIVTANSPPEPGQRIDIEILDGSERGNVYLSKKVSSFHDLRVEDEGNGGGANTDMV